MSTETFGCGCTVTFRDDGQVGAVTVCEKHSFLFSQDKSLKQLSLDIHHQQTVDKHAPKPKPVEPVDPALSA